jgi:hypothetical protein
MEKTRLLRSVETRLAAFAKWVAYGLAMTTVLGWISGFFEWGKTGLFAYVRSNLQLVWMCALSAIALALLIWVSRLQRRYATGFRDDFKGDLHANWDFNGPWRIVDKGTLLVAGSDSPGNSTVGAGITKAGATWENYTFAFKARIMDTCLGVIVRAEDLGNYYMLQIHSDRIRAHRRATIPAIDKTDSDAEEGYHPIKSVTGWQVFEPPVPITPKLSDWFKAAVTVRGQSVSLYIDDELVLQKEFFLQIPTGKVGFRNWGPERAQVQAVRVILDA